MEVLNKKQKQILDRLLRLTNGDSYMLEIALLKSAGMSDDGIPTIDNLLLVIAELKQQIITELKQKQIESNKMCTDGHPHRCGRCDRDIVEA